MNRDHEHAVVTGAGGVIGSAVVNALIARGARVTGFDQSELDVPPNLESVFATYVGDVREASRAHEVMSEAEGRFGTVRTVVLCAGVQELRSLQDGDDDWWTRLMSINLDSAFVWCKEAVSRMEHGGSIVTVASVHALVGPRLHASAAYSASKAGLVGLTKALAVELAPREIRVNSLAPSLVRSPLTESRLEDAGYRKAWFLRQPLQRLVEAKEVAAAADFLTSAAASSITGAVLPVDGGLLASS